SDLVFLNMNYKMENTLSMDISEPNFDAEFEKIKTFINMDKLNITDESEIIHIVQIMIAITMQNLMFSFTKQYTEEVSMEHYRFELKLLKAVLCKKLYDDDLNGKLGVYINDNNNLYSIILYIIT